jgi:predicted Zn finger-like uncharacterized protein
MRIICSSCESHYDIDVEKITAAGQLVRCSQCRNVRLVHAPAAASPALPAHARGVLPRLEPVPGLGGRADARGALVDFQSARARLRPWLGRIGADDGVRNTLGALAIGLFCLGASLLLKQIGTV